MTRPRTPRRRLRVARFVILCLATVVTGIGLFFFHKLQVRREAVSLRDRAAAAARGQDWPIAASLYRNYLRLEPDDAEATREFAASLEGVVKFHAAGKVVELISTYERLRGLDKLTPEDRRRLARHNLAAGRTAAARELIQDLMQAADAPPGDAELLEMAAACEEQERRLPQASDFYRRAIATGKAAPESYLRLAVVTRKNATNPNAEAEAEAVLGDLIRARPADIKARLLRAQYRLQQDKAQQARDDIEYAYRSIPGGADDLDLVQTLTSMATAKGGAALARGDFALATAEFALAQEVLSRGLAKNPGESRLQLALADVQLQMRDAPAARRTLLAVAARDLPPDQFSLDVADRLLDLGEAAAVAALAAKYSQGDAAFAGEYLTGRLRLAEGNWPAALPLLKRAAAAGLAKVPTHQAAALVGLAECYALAGDEGLRAKAVAEAVRVDPRSLRGRLAQADVLARAGRTPEALTLYAQLAPLAPSARVALLELRVQDAASRPEAERDWAVVEEAYGPEPRPPEVDVVRAKVLIYQGKAAEAEALLEKAVAGKEAAHLTGPRVALAYTRALRSPEAGLRTLDDAEKRVGDRVEFRLARLALTLRAAPIDPAAVAALGANTGPFTAADRYQLFARLGEAFAGLGRPAEAVEFTRKAAAENPIDIALRVSLFRLGVQTGDEALQERMLQEMDALEGPGSPVRAVAETTRALKDVKPGDARVAELRARLEPARAARPDWPPVEVLLADLDLLSGRGDAALAHYRRAMELGDTSEPVVANAVRLLLERQGQVEALDLLNRQARRAPLSPGLTRQLVTLRSAFGEDAARNLAWARSPELVDSKQPRDHLLRAGILEANGARGDARKAVEKALSLGDNDPEAWVALARLVAAEGKVAEAKAVAEAAAKALKPPPDRPEAAVAAALALGTCQELAGDAARAEGYARAALALAPTDVAANRQLNRLLYRANRVAEADKLFDDLARAEAASPEARRYARRMAAYAKVLRSGAPAELSAALDLLERNLQEGGDLVEDRRAKALLLSTDPARQAEAIEVLTESAKGSPLTAQENYHLGRMWVRLGRPDRAEAVLKEATRAVALALPEHLAALAQVQAARGDAAGAAATVARLKADFAATWEAATEEARVLALTNRKPEAAKLLLGGPFAADPAARLQRVAPFLETIGLGAEAEAVYREAAKSDAPQAHTPLAGYLLRAGRAAEAVELAYAHEAKAPVGVTARLLAGGARALPVALAPEATRAKWADAVRRVDEWVAAKLALNAADPDVLFAKAELDDLFGRYADELATYEKLIALAPDSDTFLNNFAMVLALVNRDGGDRPLGLINAVIDRRGKGATYLDTRAAVHLAGERPDAAIADLVVALRLDPKPAYSFHLALAEERKAGAKGSTGPRDAAIRDAARRGLTKAMLHAKEWPDFDRLMPK